jgi:hypothetical protein
MIRTPLLELQEMVQSCSEIRYERSASPMQFVPYRDLRNEPSALRKKLAREGELIVTVDNKPFAIMINLGDEKVEDILLMVSRLRAQMAARAIRSQARREGLDKMTLKDIDALIKKTRAERKR